jgi:hypothetical protein
MRGIATTPQRTILPLCEVVSTVYRVQAAEVRGREDRVLFAMSDRISTISVVRTRSFHMAQSAHMVRRLHMGAPLTLTEAEWFRSPMEPWGAIPEPSL